MNNILKNLPNIPPEKGSDAEPYMPAADRLEAMQVKDATLYKEIIARMDDDLAKEQSEAEAQLATIKALHAKAQERLDGLTSFIEDIIETRGALRGDEVRKASQKQTKENAA